MTLSLVLSLDLDHTKGFLTATGNRFFIKTAFQETRKKKKKCWWKKGVWVIYFKSLKKKSKNIVVFLALLVKK